MKKSHKNPFFEYYGKKALTVLQTGWNSASEIGEGGLNVTIRKIVHWYSKNVQQPMMQGPGSNRDIGHDAGKAPTGKPFTSHMNTFKKAVEIGDESRLDNDPLHKLARHLFRDSLKKIEQRFQAIHADVLDQLPRPSILHPTFREIWTEPHPYPQFRHRLSETVSKLFSSAKPPLVALLFCGSTVTTAWGMNELVQTPFGKALFGQPFLGEEGELARTLLSFAVGVLFSSAILDFKGRVFRNIAESGGVLKGIRNTFMRHPRWTALAAVLMAVSIKTNYDGFVTLFSKQMELSRQVEDIRHQVNAAIGSSKAVASGDMDSLYGLHAQLEGTIETILARYYALPKDEREGRASSNIAYPGPRFWGKKFIIYGGYEPGSRDVRHTFGNGPLARQVDYMLSSSGIDLSVPVADKLEKLALEHKKSLDQTTSRARHHFNEMEKNLLDKNTLFPGINRIFFLEHYQVNKVVERVVREMERHRVNYDRIMKELQGLVSRYVDILEQVDKAGGARFNNYYIEITIAPEISAIEALKRHAIPRASHRSMEDLKRFFTNQYGPIWAHLILMTVLALAAGMDLADVLLLARRTARLGIEDRQTVITALGDVLEWETAFINRSEDYFKNPELRRMLPEVAMPNRRCLQDAFYRMLEDIRPILRDRKDRSALVRTVTWFRSLFLTVRIADMEGCIDRIRTLHLFSNNREVHLRRLLHSIIPGLDSEHVLTVPTFRAHFRDIERGQMWNQVRFARDFHIAHGMEPSAFNTTLQTGEATPLMINALYHDGNNGARDIDNLRKNRRKNPKTVTLGVFLGWPAFTPVAPSWMKRVSGYLFQKTFMEPFSDFKHTRRSWLRGLDSLTGDDDELKKMIRAFGSEAVRIHRTDLPNLEKNSLLPLLDIAQRLPELLGVNKVGRIRTLEKRYRRIVRDFNEVLAAFQHLDQVRTILYTGVDGLDLDQISRQIHKGKSGQPIIVERLRKLESKFADTLAEIQHIERQTNLAINQRVYALQNACSEIQRQVISQNMRRRTLVRKGGFPPRDNALTNRRINELLGQASKQGNDIQSRLDRFEQERENCRDEHLRLLQDLEIASRNLVLEVRGLSEVFSTMTPRSNSPAGEPGMVDRVKAHLKPQPVQLMQYAA